MSHADAHLLPQRLISHEPSHSVRVAGRTRQPSAVLSDQVSLALQGHDQGTQRSPKPFNRQALGQLAQAQQGQVRQLWEGRVEGPVAQMPCQRFHDLHVLGAVNAFILAVQWVARRCQPRRMTSRWCSW